MEIGDIVKLLKPQPFFLNCVFNHKLKTHRSGKILILLKIEKSNLSLPGYSNHHWFYFSEGLICGDCQNLPSTKVFQKIG